MLPAQISELTTAAFSPPGRHPKDSNLPSPYAIDSPSCLDGTTGNEGRGVDSVARGMIRHAILSMATAIFVGPLLVGGDVAAGAPHSALEIDRTISADGVYQLSWTAEGVARLEESPTPDFEAARLVYEGRDNATTLSGRADGVYYYRLLIPSTDAPPATASVASVTVRHHPLPRAMGFFGVGLAVFLSIVVVIVRGNARADHA